MPSSNIEKLGYVPSIPEEGVKDSSGKIPELKWWMKFSPKAQEKFFNEATEYFEQEWKLGHKEAQEQATEKIAEQILTTAETEMINFSKETQLQTDILDKTIKQIGGMTETAKETAENFQVQTDQLNVKAEQAVKTLESEVGNVFESKSPEEKNVSEKIELALEMSPYASLPLEELHEDFQAQKKFKERYENSLKWLNKHPDPKEQSKVEEWLKYTEDDLKKLEEELERRQPLLWKEAESHPSRQKLEQFVKDFSPSFSQFTRENIKEIGKFIEFARKIKEKSVRKAAKSAINSVLYEGEFFAMAATEKDTQNLLKRHFFKVEEVETEGKAKKIFGRELADKDTKELRNLRLEDMERAKETLKTQENLPKEISLLIETSINILEQYYLSRGGVITPDQMVLFAELADPVLNLLSFQETKEYQDKYQETILAPTTEFLVGQFPLLDRKELERRAGGFKVEIVSSVTEPLIKWDRIDGRYDDKKRTIYIPRVWINDRHIAVHETLHALSQGASSEVSFTDRAQYEIFAGKTIRKEGLGDFLNEAVVEEITQKAVPSMETRHIYLANRKVLNQLRRWEGLPASLADSERPGKEKGEIPLEFFVANLFGGSKSLKEGLEKRGYSPEDAERFLDVAEKLAFSEDI